MESLPEEKQPATSFSLPPKKPDRLKFFLFLGLGLVILVLIGEGIYWLKLSRGKFFWEKDRTEQAGTEIFVSEEEKLRTDIISVFAGSGKNAQEILGILDESKQYDPKKFPDNSMQYSCYLAILSRLRGEYYASGGSPEKRNPEILKVLAQIREMARENTDFHEEDWEVEGAEVY